MAIRNIREDGDEILRKKCRTVEVVDEKIKELVDDMLETMYKFNGVGLAAPQVGVLKRVVVIDIDDNNGPYVFINPEIIKEKGEQEVEEGCLSFPNQFAKIIRPADVLTQIKHNQNFVTTTVVFFLGVGCFFNLKVPAVISYIFAIFCFFQIQFTKRV